MCIRDRSRTGYVICIANCPVVWVSKLQTDIALSTMEAEYSACSMSMRDVLPLLYLTQILFSGIGMDKESPVLIKTTVWEDNNALKLATMEPGRMTPRSKHYAVKYHWFRSHLAPNKIMIMKIASDDQKADMFTKALRHTKFIKNRKLTMGW